MLETRNLSYTINDRDILQNVNLSLKAGEVMAIVGPNGAGKSTLLRLLSGDLHPTSGEIHLDGKRLPDYAPRDLALKRAVMSQSALVTFEFTAYEVAMMGRYPHQRFGTGSRGDDKQIVSDAMQRTETEHLREQLYPTLSGGEAARVTLARVLAQETPLILLDEPTAALDLRHQQVVMKIARELASAGAAILAIVHDLNLAAAHADKVVMLHQGGVYAEGSPREVLTADTIENVFRLPVIVMEHPRPNGHGATPLIVPLSPSEAF
jgi:iron complex transport system ATP-binding protein